MADKDNNVIVEEILRDRKRDRRLRIFKFLVIVILVVAYLVFIFMRSKADQPGITDASKPYISLVHLNGEIMAGKNFSADRVLPVLKEAFEDDKAKGLVIEINSPGGSPVQAGIIHDYILFMKQKYHKKVVILGDDALASGAYLVATAGDKIYVHPDTLTGSIGVLMGGFGFPEIMHKVGITRRLYTAGDHKARLDPFSKLNPQDVVKVHTVLNEVHQHFINDVKESRHHLNGNPKELFSGDFWTGSHAVYLGLADGTGDVWQVMYKEFGVDQYKQYKVSPSFSEMLFGSASTMLNLHLGLQNAGVREELPN